MKYRLFDIISILISRVSGSASHLLANILIAKFLSPSSAGALFIGISIVLIASTIARAGLDNYLIKNISILSHSDDWKTARKLVRKSLVMTLSLSILISAIILTFLLSGFSNEVLSTNNSRYVLTIVFSVPFFSTFLLISSCFKAISKANIGVFLESAAWPLAFCITLISLNLVSSVNLALLSVFFLTNSVIISGLSFSFLNRLMPRGPSGPRRASIPGYKSIIVSSWAFFGIAVSNVLLRWSDILWVGHFLSEDNAAIYTISYKLAGISTLVGAAITAIIAPRYAVAYSDKNFDLVLDIFRKSALTIFLILTPIILVLVLFGEYILHLFSETYLGGLDTFRIALMLQYLCAIASPIGYMAVMADLERTFLKLILLTLGLNQLLLFTIIPAYGISGAAIATGAPPLLLNLILVIVATKRIKAFSENHR